MHLTLRRKRKTPFSILGELEGAGVTIFTIEDKWRDNAQGVSCIPAGSYDCRPHGWEANTKVRFPRVWEVCKVPDREAILIHAGNTHLDTRGCILVGRKWGFVNSELHIMESRLAVDHLRKVIGPSKFTLTIIDVVGEKTEHKGG